MKTINIEDQQRVEEIISRCDVCFVGITDLEGNPYVIPMNFGYRDGVIYLHSGPTGSSIDMLMRNNRVCVTFSIDHELVFQHPKVACSYRMKSKSVICRGRVNFIDDMDDKREALNIIMQHYSSREFTYSDPAVRNVKIWEIPIDHATAKAFAAPHQG
ncbi:pyridoxamine 5'-phosphate oxidase family protein [Bacteroides sp.]|uniref:pyridoxamine 5'-phosphate oxidase family protein n=1 Tax=Bacteroides sp. TaxID=29523 RepID=UPI001B6F08B9|nr:pyridoxamine 5'-phosphate oxidase family protein [Bacteroides sp.]MBP6065308.1 pyridoxamine 5'-phosphate oxidase family protein [Bacteroides sp.]MBP6067264.1 pyridoxamine 5'-phosphate oxidase family protein [Bacteroides sp.]MBP6936806.1 pyridoxamine 5'-phosphate oxidase family protein [Bacteroides sp.]MBP8621454.1 pyridoxamine 5'-phosphate oxidase family protein [Bacteroides sp.]MBP9586201.1 pyridoxamine 5'-phosphate oxidase family protein [Bacteroides sp.]